MIEKQIAALTTILKDRDIHEYAGDAFLNIVKAVSLGNVGALLDSSVDIKNLLFHTLFLSSYISILSYGSIHGFPQAISISIVFKLK